MHKALLDARFLLASICAILPSLGDAALPVRIPVDRFALYRVSYESLGLSAPIPAAGLSISNRGAAVAIEVEDGGDGQFGPGDSIFFYGVPVVRGDPEFKYTGENVYWLAQGAPGTPRMTGWGSAAFGPAERSYRHIHHAEESWAYWQQMPNGAGLDHWFWGKAIRAGSSRTFQFSLSGVAPGGAAAVLRLALHGETAVTADPDHRARVWLNGGLLGDIVWDGQVALTHEFTGVDPALLTEGPNTITIGEIAAPAVAADGVYVNWVEVEYDHKFTAAADRLAFTSTGSGAHTFAASGFTSAAIRIYDVTDAARPRRLNPSITAQGGGYAANFAADLEGKAAYLAVAAPAVLAAAPVAPGHGFSLKAAGDGADYIIVTHKSLADSVSTLASHRSAQGYRVKIVTTEQIYDEFSAGIFTPEAIKDFLRYAYEHWARPAPRFVVLVGDANFDYRDYLHTGQINHVPAYLIETAEVGETPTDNWYVDVAGGDRVPEMYVGRIPAKNAAEVDAVTKKIVTYESGAMPGAWPSRVLLAAGDQDRKFGASTAEWAGHLPAHYTTINVSPVVGNRNYMTRADFSRALNETGVGMVTYFGHGHVDRWQASDTAGSGVGAPLELIASEDVAGLKNYRAYPFFVAFSCLNGLFAAPNEGATIRLPDDTTITYSVPLPEALLLQPDSGAIAMWSPAAFAYPLEEHWIGLELFKQIYENGNTALGAATTQAKVNAYQQHGIHVDNLDIFVLIGDPATRLIVTGGAAAVSSGSGGGGVFDLLGLLLPLAGVGLLRLRRRRARVRAA